MARQREIAPQYMCGTIICGNDHIKSSCVMQVADRQAAGVPVFLEHWACPCRYILESGPGVENNQRGLTIMDTGNLGIYAVVHMSLRDKYILQAIIVEVGQAQPPSRHLRGDLCQSGAGAGIGKRSVAIVAIQGVALEAQVVNQQVEPAVIVVVSHVHTHAGISMAVFINRNTGKKAAFLKRPVSLVMQQHLRPVVVGNKNIRPSVLIIVADINPEALNLQIGEAGLGGYIGEMAAAIIVVESQG